MSLMEQAVEDFDVISPSGDVYRTIKAALFIRQVPDSNYFEAIVTFNINSNLQSYDVIRRKADGKTYRMCKVYKIYPISESEKTKYEWVSCNAVPYECIAY